jgi:hypothetical protein
MRDITFRPGGGNVTYCVTWLRRLVMVRGTE